MKRLLLTLAIATIGVLVFILGIRFFLTGTVRVVLDPTSTATNQAYASFSNDKFKKHYSFPATIKLRQGKYIIFASAENSTTFQEEILVESGKVTATTVKLLVNPTNSLTDTNHDGQTLAENPYLSLFPHYDDYFEIKAEVGEKDGKPVITNLIVTPFVAATSASQTVSDLQALSVEYVNQAKSWLKTKNVPDTIPLTINSPY